MLRPSAPGRPVIAATSAYRERVAQDHARPLGTVGVLGTRDDRRERPVDVQQDRGPLRRFTQSSERVHAHTIRAVVRLAVIGIVAGFFSALLGVGGGLITVPLLLIVAHFSERPAMATSLGAIGITALAGTIRYAFHGDVEWGYAALVGLPASVGALVGTSLQQRIANRWLALAFAALLVVVGVLLLVV